ncbi:DUF2695 domain-containing protein [Arthrobacter sp.]|uniref:DUF2695 domain-containing protein n=1 Tax=Arthrobacter sp. TaxID=1667 RepID=UPI00258CCCE9|nr:DUF2695 domain-containing protein [Arthrobacter sp.]
MEHELPDEVRRDVDTLGMDLTLPLPHECLFCYVWSMVLCYGCHGLHWAKRYQELCAPRATALVQRLEAHGGYCDCEMFMNVVGQRFAWWLPAPDDGVDDWEDGTGEPEKPPCLGARKGSTQACDLWFGRGGHSFTHY